MIFHDIEFFRPHSIDEAVAAYRECSDAAMDPEYFAGGTELVTMARDGKVSAGAFIDLKAVPETRQLGPDNGELHVGSSLRLNDIAANLGVPLAARCIDNLADHTVRNSITLGGNIAGRLPYREAMLPFLLADASAVVAGIGESGGAASRRLPLRELFDKRLRLSPGEFLLSLSIPEEFSKTPFWYKRWVRSARVDYPIVTLACVASGDSLLFASSGSFAYPVWGSIPLPDLGGNQTEAVLESFLDGLGEFRRDARASAEYRRAMMSQGLFDAFHALQKQVE
jgi:CO/xanthine dehydrogenase FAD-binding subunit